jgi:hypothetical protein
MATERLSVRKAREILRQKWELGRTHREIAAGVGQSLGAVAMTLGRAKAAGLDWAQAQALTDTALEDRIYGPKAEMLARPMPTFEKLFVDYSGKKPRIVDPKTGEVVEVELFVAVLDASNYTFAEATLTQRVPDFIASHLRAFSFFGGVTSALVPDQLKSGVVVACRYEPGLQRTYEEMALHYGTAVLPARPAHPRDKAKVEVGVQIVQRWILARLRNETFFSLAALNERIAELLENLNDRRMRVYGASRRELFVRLDRPALKRLPSTPFEDCARGAGTTSGPAAPATSRWPGGGSTSSSSAGASTAGGAAGCT